MFDILTSRKHRYFFLEKNDEEKVSFKKYINKIQTIDTEMKYKILFLYYINQPEISANQFIMSLLKYIKIWM
jgi:hypothetical protein